MPSLTATRAGSAPDLPAEGQRRILIIDDDPGLVQNLRHNLELDGHVVLVESLAAWGVAQVRAERPHLLITGLAALERDDFKLLRDLRTEFDALPVLVISPRVVEATVLRGFRVGFDDFVLRPVPVSELHARIDACLRRGTLTPALPSPGPDVISFGQIEIRVLARTVSRSGVPVELRAKEFDLLLALAMRQGRVAPRMELLREVWGYRSWVATRTIDTHVAELRRKLERDPAEPDHIITVRKVGYRLDAGGPALAATG